ncbi:unnamed protein product [Closterium sp. Naga37s-1]|nr:unnamed protein product [Closterium sp. Naga37s-1]
MAAHVSLFICPFPPSLHPPLFPTSSSPPPSTLLVPSAYRFAVPCLRLFPLPSSFSPPPVFRWRMAAHDVWRLRDLAAYTNCTFATGKRLTPVRTSYRYKYKVPVTAAGTTLFFACSIPSHCSVFRMKTQIPVSP